LSYRFEAGGRRQEEIKGRREEMELIKSNKRLLENFLQK
jgi:hypothetical protein